MKPQWGLFAQGAAAGQPAAEWRSAAGDAFPAAAQQWPLGLLHVLAVPLRTCVLSSHLRLQHTCKAAARAYPCIYVGQVTVQWRVRSVEAGRSVSHVSVALDSPVFLRLSYVFPATHMLSSLACGGLPNKSRVISMLILLMFCAALAVAPAPSVALAPSEVSLLKAPLTYTPRRQWQHCVLRPTTSTFARLFDQHQCREKGLQGACTAVLYLSQANARGHTSAWLEP